MKYQSSSINVYKPSFLDILVQGKGLEKAKARVQYSGGKYFYEPSKEFKEAREKLHISRKKA